MGLELIMEADVRNFVVKFYVLGRIYGLGVGLRGIDVG